MNWLWFTAGYRHAAVTFCKFLFIISLSKAQISERVKNGVALKNLTPDVALVTCFKWLPVADVPANQVYIQTQDGGILSGLPWDVRQAKLLQKRIVKAGGKPIKHLIINELNIDRLAVIEYFYHKGVRCITDTTTAGKLAQKYQIQADLMIHSDTSLIIGKRHIILFPLGKGFSDNGLAIFLPDSKILHAGYFITSATTRYPVIHSETSLSEWVTNLEKLYFRFSDARKVIPSQGQPNDANLIKYSAFLVNKIIKKSMNIANF